MKSSLFFVLLIIPFNSGLINIPFWNYNTILLLQLTFRSAIMNQEGGMGMTLEELIKIEEHGAEHGWVAPLTDEDRQYFYHFREVLKRYNINPSTATKLEYEFVIRVAEAEFYGIDERNE